MIFISYSHEEKKFVTELTDRLSALGVSAWRDTRDIISSTRWDTEIQKALQNCEAIIVVLSRNSVQSQNVLDEIGYALEHDKKIFPILIQDCEIPYRIARIQFIDFRNDHQSGITRLHNELERAGVDTDNGEIVSSIRIKLIGLTAKFRQRKLIGVAILLFLLLVLLIDFVLWPGIIGLACGGKISVSDVYHYTERAKQYRDYYGRYYCAERDFENAFKYAKMDLERAQLYYGLSTIAHAKNDPELAHKFALEGLKYDSMGEPLLYLSDGLALCQMEQKLDATEQLAIFLEIGIQSPFSQNLVQDLYEDILDNRYKPSDCHNLALDLP